MNHVYNDLLWCGYESHSDNHMTQSQEWVKIRNLTVNFIQMILVQCEGNSMYSKQKKDTVIDS